MIEKTNRWHLLFECFRFYFWKIKILKESVWTDVTCSPSCAGTLDTFYWMETVRLKLACTRYDAYCCSCMCVPVCVVCYDATIRFFAAVLCSVGVNYSFSIQNVHQFEHECSNIWFSTTQLILPCCCFFFFCTVESDVICLCILL